MAEGNRIGAKVAQVRASREISPQELAARSELPEGLIEQIESGALIPSLAPLIKIARVLGVRLGTFLDDQDRIGPVVSRESDRRPVMRFSERRRAGRSELDFFALAPDKASRHMEPFVVVIDAASAEQVTPSAHEGEEFLFVLEGAVEVLYGRETYRLAAGDSIYYDSIVPHHVHARDGREARILAVVYTPW